MKWIEEYYEEIQTKTQKNTILKIKTNIIKKIKQEINE